MGSFLSLFHFFIFFVSAHISQFQVACAVLILSVNHIEVPLFREHD